jgi:hypothetical protein
MVLRKLIFVSLVWGCLAFEQEADARTFGEFLKAVGDSIAHAGERNRTPSSQKKEASRKTNKEQSPGASPTPSATPVQETIRVASLAPDAGAKKRDVPYGIPAANRPGFVTSPYAPNQGLVDVRNFPSGTEVKDPYTGKIFLTP